MNVKKIKVIHFRNFLELSIYFHPFLNIFIGDNAQGKTNIIEAVYTLLRGYSYRTRDDQNLIYWNMNQGYLLGEVQKDQDIFQINILLQNVKKNYIQLKKINKIIKVNKKNQKKSWLLKKFHPVIFTPEDLQIIKSSPSVRRKFLDEVIINLLPVYERYLKDYHHILFQRNILLKNSKNRSEINHQLEVWDYKIIELGTQIILFRIKVLQKLNQKAKILHQKMTENKETIKLKYHSNVLTNYTDDPEEISKIMEYKLHQAIEKDFNLKMTTIGPHRDDFAVMNNAVDLGIYGSQGQQRTAALSLKLAELELFQEKEDEYPPLLLDDVMSELDLSRRRFLMKLIQDRSMQTFITSISLDDLTQLEMKKNLKLFQVNNGIVEEK